MAKKILLASGCSYTDPNYKSCDPDVDPNWKMWPELMANELNLQCVNKAMSGKGADHILDSILEQLAAYGDRVDTVAILWSTSDRLPFFNFTLNPIIEINTPHHPSGVDPFPWLDDIGVGRVSQKYFNSAHFQRNDVYRAMILNPIRKIFAIMEICEKRNIKFVMFSGLVYFDHFAINHMVENKVLPENCAISSSEVVKTLLHNPIFAEIDKRKKHFIGWPILKEMGGYTYDDLRYGKEEYFISKLDKHPSKAGQETIARCFVERYNDIYSS